jgi:hypothetical protein
MDSTSPVKPTTNITMQSGPNTQNTSLSQSSLVSNSHSSHSSHSSDSIREHQREYKMSSILSLFDIKTALIILLTIIFSIVSYYFYKRITEKKIENMESNIDKRVNMIDNSIQHQQQFINQKINLLEALTAQQKLIINQKMDEFTSVVQLNISSLRNQQNEFLDRVNSMPKINIQEQQSQNRAQSNSSSSQISSQSPQQSPPQSSSQYLPQSPPQSSPRSSSPVNIVTPVNSNNSSPHNYDSRDILNMGIPSIANVPILEILGVPMSISMQKPHKKSSVVIEEDNGQDDRDDDLDTLLKDEYEELKE